MEGKLEELVDLFDKSYGYDYGTLFKNGGVQFTGLSGSSRVLFILTLFRTLDRPIIIVTRNNREAEQILGDLSLFLGDSELYLIPSKETLPYDDSTPFRELTVKRITAFDALLQKKGGSSSSLRGPGSICSFRERRTSRLSLL